MEFPATNDTPLRTPESTRVDVARLKLLHLISTPLADLTYHESPSGKDILSANAKPAEHNLTDSDNPLIIKALSFYVNKIGSLGHCWYFRLFQ